MLKNKPYLHTLNLCLGENFFEEKDFILLGEILSE